MTATSKLDSHNKQALVITIPPPPLKFTVHEWHANKNLRCQHSATEQLLANQIVTECKRLSEVAIDEAKRNKGETDQQLKRKLDDIRYCKNELLHIRKNILLETDALSTYEKRITNALCSIKNVALATCERCLYAREQRVGIDLVNDNVDRELLKECTVIKGVEHLLKQLLEQTHEQIRRLKATLYFIDRDLKDKEKNFDIDHNNLTLKPTSCHLNLYTGISQLHKSPFSLIEWDIHTSNNIQAAGKELQNARSLHCYIDTIIKQTTNDLKKQKESTDKALEHHIHDTKEIKIQLELQHAKVMRQASEITSNIAHMQKVIEEQQRYLALAHTRSSARCQRPETELTQDFVEKSLSKEIYGLEGFVLQLQKSLCEVQAALRYLLKMQVQIEEQINIKTNTLRIDEVQCTALRHDVNYHVY